MVGTTALLCLALNLFHEARGESVPGQYAVAQVTMRRAKNDPERVCEAVYAKKQFSWTHQAVGKRDPARVDLDAWKRAIAISRVVLEGRMPLDFTNGSDHYHAKHVKPSWTTAMVKTRVMGRHVFYRSSKSVISEEA